MTGGTRERTGDLERERGRADERAVERAEERAEGGGVCRALRGKGSLVRSAGLEGSGVCAERGVASGLWFGRWRQEEGGRQERMQSRRRRILWCEGFYLLYTCNRVQSAKW